MTTGADWLEACGTSGALTLGLALYYRDFRDRRRAQARKVSAWVVNIQDLRARDEFGVDTSQMGGQSAHVRARNASDEGVYDFVVWVRHDYSSASGAMGSRELAFLKPGESDIWVDGVTFPDGGLAGLPHLMLTFVDSAGRRWQRSHTGELRTDRFSPNAKVGPWRRWRRLRRRRGLRP